MRDKSPCPLAPGERTKTKGFSSKIKKSTLVSYTDSHTHAPSCSTAATTHNDWQENEHRKNTNNKFHSISIPSHSSSHNNHHNNKSFNFTTSINITNSIDSQHIHWKGVRGRLSVVGFPLVPGRVSTRDKRGPL
jgi:hypothetical protein